MRLVHKLLWFVSIHVIFIDFIGEGWKQHNLWRSVKSLTTTSGLLHLTPQVQKFWFCCHFHGVMTAIGKCFTVITIAKFSPTSVSVMILSYSEDSFFKYIHQIISLTVKMWAILKSCILLQSLTTQKLCKRTTV